MSTQVRETAAGKVISAYVILNPKGKHVATVQSVYGSVCRVDVWHHGDATTEKTVKALGYTLDEGGRIVGGKLGGQYAYHAISPQQGTAGGGGYDKFAAALSGLVIDGHTMGDHSSSDGAPKKPRGSTVYPRDFKLPKGYSLANWDRDAQGYRSCHKASGLKYLEALGYTVIQAL